MRIINQRGIVDMPYECTILNINNDAVTTIAGYGEQVLFAKYSTPEKAQKAMKMLHDAYRDEHSAEMGENGNVIFGRNYIFRFPQDDDV